MAELDPRDHLEDAIAQLNRQADDARALLLLVAEPERPALVSEIAGLLKLRAEFVEMITARDALRWVNRGSRQ